MAGQFDQFSGQLPPGIAVGAGLSGFAQGFASTFLRGEEQRHAEKMEQKKLAAEAFLKHGLTIDDPAAFEDPNFQKSAQSTFGDASPMLLDLFKANAAYRKKAAADAAAAVPGVGETISYKTPGGLDIKKTGPAQPKAGKSPEEIERDAAARARGAASVTGPAQVAKENRAENRQMRREARALKIKLEGPIGLTGAQKLRNAQGQAADPRKSLEQNLREGFTSVTDPNAVGLIGALAQRFGLAGTKSTPIGEPATAEAAVTTTPSGPGVGGPPTAADIIRDN